MRTYKAIDAHIHVDSYGEADRQAMLQQAFASGIQAVIAVSMHLESSKVNEQLARQFPGRVHPAYGFHPEQPILPIEEREELFAWIRAKHAEGEAFAIGEVGLPYYSRSAAVEEGLPFNEEPYLDLLDRFALLASELNRPIVLHAVHEDGAKACDIMERHQVKKVHFHWFKGDEATVERMIRLGYMISVTPDVAYENEIRSLVERYPLEQLMAETDGPWPFEGPYEGKMTVPEMVHDVAAHIAAIKQLPEKEVREQLLRNTREFYAL
ncbi:TatD family hydrolase [Paenibacillus glycanilyticus]|uniref:TatD family hydrolase n=1 Tax=Paenibacillus glycanilyticus TaxID=126569 RepID=UPI00203D3928|nr:TatD family hydrolase [Paenibacillus glycanilyticus]MCM3626004.1 TatD family hydrolase [Paenibacillus glycanilyticus]